MTQAQPNDPFTLETLALLAMALVAGVIALEADAALGWSLLLGALVGAALGPVIGFSPVLLAAVGAGAAACGAIMYNQIDGELARRIRVWVRIGRWNPDGVLALQAGLGAAFGGLMSAREFRHALVTSLNASGLSFVLIGTALSMLLIVPFHRALLGETPALDEPHAAPAGTVAQFAAARRYLKPSFVLLGLYIVEYLNKAVEDTIRNSTWSLAIIMFSVLAAGIVTWYWSAALREAHVGTWAALGRTVAFGTLFGLPFTLGAILPSLWSPVMTAILQHVGSPDMADHPGVLPTGQEQHLGPMLAGLIVFLVALALSAFASALLLGIFSFFGEYLIRGLRRVRTGTFYFGLLAVLMLAAVIPQMALAIVSRRGPAPLIGPLHDLTDLFYPALAAGWVLGLWLGNFAEAVRPPPGAIPAAANE